MNRRRSRIPTRVWLTALIGGVVCMGGGCALVHGAKKVAPEATFQVKRNEFRGCSAIPRRDEGDEAGRHHGPGQCERSADSAHCPMAAR